MIASAELNVSEKTNPEITIPVFKWSAIKKWEDIVNRRFLPFGIQPDYPDT
jgi:hypothetical protein